MKAGDAKASTWKVWAKTKFSGLAVVMALAVGSHPALANTTSNHSVTSSHSPRHYAESRASRHVMHHEYAYYHHEHYTHYAHYASAHYRGRVRLAHYYSNSHYRELHYSSAVYRYSRLQCVPYAREVSHIGLSGDAFLWWAEASGRYARGSVPVEGAVLNFRSIRRMPLGHVAVVTSVIDSRTILVTQANWVRGSITNDVTMQDVSPNNDWTQVQVELGDSSRWGAAYPTYGFIYNQPAYGTSPGTIYASASGQGDEVAEAPRPAPIMTEAPDRNLQ